MEENWQQLLAFLEEEQRLVAWTVSLSIVMFLGSLIAVPILIIQMRADFFVRDAKRWSQLTPLQLLGRLLKNLVGMVFFLAGVAMLVLPGQGLLTIALGVSLLDFPGKRRLELRLVRLTTVNRSISWIREKANREPLVLPEG